MLFSVIYSFEIHANISDPMLYLQMYKFISIKSNSVQFTF